MRRIKQAGALLRLLPERGAVRAFLRWKPFSITAFRMLRALHAQGLRFRTIVDAGANIGQFARAAAETYPDAMVFSFEALPDIAETLRQNLADRPRVHVVQSALGATEGSLTFYRNRYSLASSALPLTGPQQPMEELSVPVTRLDTCFEGRSLASPVLLKLDLQGYEIEAMKGAGSFLQQCDYVLVETAFKGMYEQEPLFDEVYAFMRGAGFRFLRPIDVLEDAAGEMIQMDALFQYDRRHE